MRRPRPAGFTLIEVLSATALFAVLGLLLFQVLQGAMEVQGRGERLAALEESAGAALDVLAEDLRHLWAGPVGEGATAARLLCSQRETLLAEPPAAAQTVAVLRFTRLLHEARRLDWLARAGDVPAAQEVATFTGHDDPAGLQPTGGLAESLYTVARLPGEALPSLVRRVRSPIGGSGSLLDPLLPEQEDRLLTGLVPIAAGVLHFGVTAWGPATTTWEAAPQEAATAATPFWDSTRGLIAPGAPLFPYGRGAASLDEPSDDLYPTHLRLSLVLDPFVRGDPGLGAAGRLAEDLALDGTELQLTAAALSGDELEPGMLWLEGEWLEVRAHDGRRWTVGRGARGTRPARHAAGSPVRVGLLFDRVVRLPAARENWNP